jgi:hypothetical protein
MPDLARLNPFRTPDARRLALLFAVVYFAQGMWYLPNQTLTVVEKVRGEMKTQVHGECKFVKLVGKYAWES